MTLFCSVGALNRSNFPAAILGRPSASAPAPLDPHKGVTWATFTTSGLYIVVDVLHLLFVTSYVLDSAISQLVVSRQQHPEGCF